jgi:hypothetical protein
MTKEQLKNFLYKESITLSEALNGYLFLYIGNDYLKHTRTKKLALLIQNLSKIINDKTAIKEYSQSLKNDKKEIVKAFIYFVKQLLGQRKEYKNLITDLKLLYSNYKNNINLIERIIVSEAPPIILNKKGKMEVKYILDSSIKNGGNYRNEIYKAFNNNKIGISAKDLENTLIKNNVGFIDLIPIPLPFNSKLRTKWSTDKKFEIENKPLPLVLLELALDENFSKKKISQNVKICFMMPVNTSMGIIDFSMNNKHDIETTFGIFISHERICANNSETKTSTTIRGLSSLVLPLHKRNSFSSGNTPNYLLIKNALE